MTMQNQSPVLVAIDDGFRQIKLLSSEQHKLTQLSVVGPGFTLGGSAAAAGDAGFGAYRTGGRDYTVDPDISNKEGTRYDGYALSDLNRVLVHHALHTAGLGGRDVVLATGLPYARYYQSDGELLEKKIDNLSIAVEAMTGAQSPRLIAQHVLPQAVMAYMDYAYDDSLSGFKTGVDPEMPVVVIDVGGGTTDIATVLPNGNAPKVDRLKSGTINTGVLDTLKELTARLERRFQFTGVRESLLERCVRTRKVLLRGQLHDISDDIAAAVDVAVQPILREMQRLVGSAASETPLLVGGGAALVADALRTAYPHMVVAEDPEFANARGMLKTLQQSYAQ